MKIGALITGFLLFSGPHVGAGALLDVHASPSFSSAPATVRIRVTVAPDAANRGLAVIADSGSFSRSSEVTLEGDRAPRTIIVEYPSLPAGAYEVRGVLVGSRGQALAVAHTNITVAGAARK